MNLRILELAQEAGLKWPSETALSPVEEKFAQLIVDECVNVVANAVDHRVPASEYVELIQTQFKE